MTSQIINRILEDELMLRIESGIEVFGKQLKIYRRKGIFGRQYILSNGRRPDLLAEDFDGNLYGKNIFVEFVRFIREEKKFDSLDELKVQLNKDKQKAKKLLQ